MLHFNALDVVGAAFSHVGSRCWRVQAVKSLEEVFSLRISSSVDIIFRDRCGISYASAPLLHGRRAALNTCKPCKPTKMQIVIDL